MNNKKTAFLAIIVLLIVGILIFNATQTTEKPTSVQESSQTAQGEKTMQDSQQNTPNLSANADTTFDPKGSTPPAMQIDKTKTYTAVVHTSQGDITIKLAADKTPITVNNFVALAKVGFYNNTPFHRVISGFMIQGGDPLGNGTGGPGYKFADEPFTGEYTRGTVAMANAGPNTNGSQFFIMHQDNPLPKNYVIFGQITSGMDVVDKIAEGKVTSQPTGERSKPVNPVKVTSVNIDVQ